MSLCNLCTCTVLYVITVLFEHLVLLCIYVCVLFVYDMCIVS